MAQGPCSALDREAKRLIQRNHPIVFVEDALGEKLYTVRVGFARRRLARRFPFARRAAKWWHANNRSGLQAMRRLRALTIDPYLPGAQQLFQRPVAQFRVAAFEPPVGAQPGFVGRDLNLFDPTHVRIARTAARPANKAPTDSTTDDST